MDDARMPHKCWFPPAGTALITLDPDQHPIKHCPGCGKRLCCKLVDGSSCNREYGHSGDCANNHCVDPYKRAGFKKIKFDKIGQIERIKDEIIPPPPPELTIRLRPDEPPQKYE